MSDNKKDNNNNYEVGYKKPPKHTQFGAKNGNPRNKKGRILKDEEKMLSLSPETLRKIIMNDAMTTVYIGDKEVPRILAIIRQTGNLAAKGNVGAMKLYTELLTRASKEHSQILEEWTLKFLEMKERMLNASRKPGSLEHYDAMHQYFMFKKDMRLVEGAETWPYEPPHEPETREEWHVFFEQFEIVQKDPTKTAQWPPPYHRILQEQETEWLLSLPDEEYYPELLNVFKHRQKMREKEGIRKWPRYKQEPVNDKEWQIFEKYIKEMIENKESTVQWPPEEDFSTRLRS